MILCQSSCTPSYVALSDDDDFNDHFCEEVRYEDSLHNNDDSDEVDAELQEVEEEAEIPDDLDEDDMEVADGIYYPLCV